MRWWLLLLGLLIAGGVGLVVIAARHFDACDEAMEDDR